MFRKKEKTEHELGMNNMNGMTNQDKVCDITNMNCLNTEDNTTADINDLNQKSADNDVVCSLNDMNCNGSR